MSEPRSKPAKWSPKKRGASNHNKNKFHNRKRRIETNSGAAAEARKPACTVCSDPEKASSYKCPKCRALYCSVVCCKEHKKICPQKPQETSSNSKDISGTFASFNLTQLRPSNETQKRFDEDDDNSLEDEWKLTDEMKRAMEESQWLRAQLQADGGLRNVIRQIAESRNVESMQEVTQRFPNFQVFLDKLMVVAGVLEREQELDDKELEPLDEWLQRDLSQDPTPPRLSLKLLRRRMPDFQPVDLSTSSEDDSDQDESTSSSDENDDSHGSETCPASP